ncbi:Interferon-induced GTP-binding protein Mx-like protein [Emericellopsis cladophorae]|uniref:Interferon-induced GTP-binding protein Mx-like protein n=1 Tax=Emericellopsis cladophorae TaxID=2686198 RepID=A0A9P9Y3I6_9HYPO|nr:Interferon-induced GTP-binding protein Mx-like protein [Emericellopsis cladophorae]KAI6782831.1 Interferon-induced GTP-binding protein Mx-like protein [Emericellopsis cladophorae]
MGSTQDYHNNSSMHQSLDSSLATQGLADEQRGLLDLIDKLQFAQLDNVKLPQIVVVGDQSAGKSSVLEALSGTPFPRDAGACTRFATEIRLRRAKETSLKVSIIPDKKRPFNDQQRMKEWGASVGPDASFEAMMRQATELIAPREIPGRFAARDILVVEKCGPDMPLLTMVDLPGLVRVANRDQSDTDISTIDALSDRYMKSSRTIILAVIGGNNDYVQAPILKKARHFDPTGARTIGVLTKPDMTERIGIEDKFIDLVMNKDPENHFKLGWYVLLNPGPNETWFTPEQRLQREAEFFSRGKWAGLPPTTWGVGSLRTKLSSQLQRHIGKHVKTLRRQIQQSLERCETQLRAMGAGKDTVEEMRFEMGELFTASNNLVTPAVNGNYKNPFGEKFFSRQSSPKGTPSQKLRARVREESDRFARRFRQHGRKVNFGTGPDGHSFAAGTVGDPAKQAFAQNEVEPLLRQIRGNELPLDSNPRAPYILFQDYSRNWPLLAQEYKENLGVICHEFLADVIDHVWPMRMRDPLRFRFLELKMKECMEKATTELGRLSDDMELEVQPFDPEYEERLRAWRAAATVDGGTYSEAEEVLEKMLIYYDLTARIFVRNVITQVVERHLLLGMLRLFNPIEILRMPNETVEAIAAENKETRDRRLALKAQKEAIEEARNICASLAMRSELRAHDDEPDDEVTDEEDGSQPAPTFMPQRQSRTYHQQGPPAAQQQQQQQQQQQKQQQAQHEPPSRRPVRADSPHTATTPQETHTNGSRRPESWEHSEYMAASSGTGQAPAHAPPPPPRPSKVGFEEDAGSAKPERTKDSARSRIFSSTRFG